MYLTVGESGLWNLGDNGARWEHGAGGGLRTTLEKGTCA